MLGIARLVEKGPLTAASVAALMLLCGLVLQLVLALGTLIALLAIICSSAVIAFVILRHGEYAGLKTIGISTIVLALTSLMLFRTVWQIPVYELLFWVPSGIAAVALRRFQNLGMALLVLTLIGVLVVISIHLFAPDATAFWREQMLAGMSAASEQQRELISIDQVNRVVDSMARLMTGAVGVSVVACATCSLYLARYWQAGLFNPGGFQQEFHALSLGRLVALVGAGIMFFAVMYGGPFGTAISMVLVFAFFIQGLSVSHALVKQRGLSQGWLVGIYIMLLLPHTVLLLGALGLTDNLFGLRRT